MINLEAMTNDGKVHNLAGKERGENARDNFSLDSIDTQEENVTIVIPEHVYAVSSSFFLGMFSNSLKSLGGKEAFLQKYKFDSTPLVLKQVLHGIERWESSNPQA
ncbi:hypothetical protein GCM10011332_09000 [Terasakiella brassicae]|uniref:DUF4325 domain-containing protein n=1 Tax=Terasakiella brassicae TaxID=1634917 RepID=A0A917F9I1_9PROT|nr:hypothetical protein [Terasakiella brassicae]GGF57718.1 hypothetical protein GCM10011332_09000 [Terasakiella brassicae]